MERYYMVVLGIATVLLILILAVMGVLLTYQNSNQIYPPTTNTCPDYWKVDVCGNCICPSMGSRNVGLCNPSDVSFSCVMKPVQRVAASSTWSFNPTDTNWASATTTSVCAKKNWANNNNIVWDGISNYNSC